MKEKRHTHEKQKSEITSPLVFFQSMFIIRFLENICEIWKFASLRVAKFLICENGQHTKIIYKCFSKIFIIQQTCQNLMIFNWHLISTVSTHPSAPSFCWLLIFLIYQFRMTTRKFASVKLCVLFRSLGIVWNQWRLDDVHWPSSKMDFWDFFRCCWWNQWISTFSAFSPLFYFPSSSSSCNPISLSWSEKNELFNFIWNFSMFF